MQVTYTADFPEKSRAKVDAAIEQADIEFFEESFKSTAAVKRFVVMCVSAFALEACAVAAEAGWSVGRIDREVESAFNRIAEHALRDKYRRHAHGDYSKHQFRTAAWIAVEESESWKEYRRKRLALVQAISGGSVTPARGTEPETGDTPSERPDQSITQAFKTLGLQPTSQPTRFGRDSSVAKPIRRYKPPLRIRGGLPGPSPSEDRPDRPACRDSANQRKPSPKPTRLEALVIEGTENRRKGEALWEFVDSRGGGSLYPNGLMLSTPGRGASKLRTLMGAPQLRSSGEIGCGHSQTGRAGSSIPGNPLTLRESSFFLPANPRCFNPVATL